MGILQIASFAVYALLGSLSLFAVGLGIYKLVQFVRIGVGRRAEAERILDDWLDGRVEEAISTAREHNSVLARILHAVFSGIQARPTDTSYAEELSRQTAIRELAKMSDWMRSLDMVVQAAPMLGLLGTVVGMIDAFSVLALSEGAVDPTGLAGGIYLALTTTAAGLMIALVAFFVATLLETRIDRERNMMEALMSAAIHGRVDPKRGRS
ncbi:MAG: MotA/TolQ/ExbB proton channel family protein [Shimia sp.]